jgi:hypothetical protein
MELLNYLKKFPDEARCVQYFRSIRENTGLGCSICGGKIHRWEEEEHKFKCIRCGHETSLRNGTVMEHSALPLKYWFLSIYLMTIPERPYTSMEIKQKMDYFADSSIDDMVDNLDRLRKRTNHKFTFDMLLYACAGGLRLS